MTDIATATRRGLRLAMADAGVAFVNEAAKRSKLDARTLARLDEGTTLGTVYAICEGLGCSPGDICPPLGGGE